MSATVTAAGTAGYVDRTRGIPEAPASPALTDIIKTAYSLTANRSRYITEMYHFTSIDDTDTWASGITGIQIVFAANALAMGDDDNVCARLTSAGGVVTFQAEANGGEAYILLFVDPVASGRAGVRGL